MQQSKEDNMTPEQMDRMFELEDKALYNSDEHDELEDESFNPEVWLNAEEAIEYEELLDTFLKGG